jgi:hypothetical protein
MNGTHQLLVFADDANLLGDNTDAIKKNTETSTDASKGLGLEINVENIKYVSLSSPECRAKSGYTNRERKYVSVTVLVRALCYKPQGSLVRDPMR